MGPHRHRVRRGLDSVSGGSYVLALAPQTPTKLSISQYDRVFHISRDGIDPGM